MAEKTAKIDRMEPTTVFPTILSSFWKLLLAPFGYFFHYFDGLYGKPPRGSRKIPWADTI